jgi:hypothetical protein
MMAVHNCAYFLSMFNSLHPLFVHRLYWLIKQSTNLLVSIESLLRFDFKYSHLFEYLKHSYRWLERVNMVFSLNNWQT